MRKRILVLLFIIVLVISPKVTNAWQKPVYRALLIGNANYWNGNNLSGSINDLTKMENALKNNYFDSSNQSFKKISKSRDLSKNQMINKIREEFRDAREGDTSYFYYSGHGGFNSQSNTAYLVGVDGIGLTVSELESELKKIPGTVVIILDSCHSGGFIEQSKYSMILDNEIDEYISETDIEKYNDSIIDVFSQKKSRNYLSHNKYKVLTAASVLESSYELGYTDGWDWGGEFTRAFVLGNGYNNRFLADTNYDNNVTLNEIYNYTKDRVKGSNVQVYPMVDNHIIGSRFNSNSSSESELWDTFYNIEVDKVWEIKFNMELDENSWNNRIYILDSNNNYIPISLSKSLDEKAILIYPNGNYKYNEKYTIAIEDNISSKRGSKLKKKVIANFYTEEGIDYGYTSLAIVQNGYFYSHPYPSVKDAFDNFFFEPLWKYFYSTDYNHVVEFQGGVIKDGVPGIITIQFVVDIENGTFKVEYAAFNKQPISRYSFEGLLDIIYDYSFNEKSNMDIEEVLSDDEHRISLDNKRLP